MFTGIITDIGKITQAENGNFLIQTNWNMETIKLGDSIACAGICLTVKELANNHFKVYASNETLNLTTAKFWQRDTQINLERALRVGDELGGHMVSGHVDGIAEIIDISGSTYTIKSPHEFSRYIARKGSITLDGVSLTVNTVDVDLFTVNIIPYTLQHTTFQFKKSGDLLNLEIDTIARYLERFAQTRT